MRARLGWEKYWESGWNKTICTTESLEAGRKTQFCHFAPESDVSELCRELVSLAAARRVLWVAARETNIGTHHRHLDTPSLPSSLHPPMPQHTISSNSVTYQVIQTYHYHPTPHTRRRHWYECAAQSAGWPYRISHQSFQEAQMNGRYEIQHFLL